MRHYAILTAASNGSWRKRWNNRAYFFGSWKTGTQEEALKRWRDEWPNIVRGIPIASGSVAGLTGGYISWSNLVTAYATTKREEYDSGIIREVTLKKILSRCKTMGKLGSEVWKVDADVDELNPNDFRALDLAIRKKYRSPSSAESYIRHVRAVLRWGFDSGLLKHAARLGNTLRGPSKTDKRTWERTQQSVRGEKFIDRDELLLRIDHASKWFRLVLLLGINAGFGPTDCRDLRKSDIGKDGLIDYTRHKTGVVRIVQLWPETTRAIELVHAPGEMVVCTRTGEPWKDGFSSAMWKKQTTALNKDRDDDSKLRTQTRPYWLRHTMLSVCPDEHRDGSRYLAGQEVGDALHEIYVHDKARMIEKAKAASAYVRSWLYGYSASAC